MAGKTCSIGCRDGKGADKLFRTIRGFTQLTKDVVVVSDMAIIASGRFKGKRVEHPSLVVSAKLQDTRIIFRVNLTFHGLSSQTERTINSCLLWIGKQYFEECKHRTPSCFNLCKVQLGKQNDDDHTRPKW